MTQLTLTPQQLKQARAELKLSASGFARLVMVEDGRTVRRWEAGERSIPGPVIVIVHAILSSPAVREYFLPQIPGP